MRRMQNTQGTNSCDITCPNNNLSNSSCSSEQTISDPVIKKDLESDIGSLKDCSTQIPKERCATISKEVTDSLRAKILAKDITKNVPSSSVPETQKSEDFLPNLTKLADISQEEEDSIAESSLCEVSTNPESQEETLESNDRSDGSDSGLGSDLAEDRGVPGDCLSSGSADESGSTVASGQADSEEGAVSSGSDSETHFLDRIQDDLVESSKDITRSVSTIEIPGEVLESNSDVISTSSGEQQILSDHTLDNFEHSDFSSGYNKNQEEILKKKSVGESSESFLELPNISSSSSGAMGTNYSSSQSQSSAEEDADLSSILAGASQTVSHKSRSRSNLKRRLSYDDRDAPRPKKKRSISFDKVTVYYFPRAQGFTCVPSQGGSTLGMASQHAHIQQFSILEHAVEQRRLHRQVRTIHVNLKILFPKSNLQ